MACAFITNLIFISLGIQLSFAASVNNSCGRLSYDEPAVAGRIVTLNFKPVRVFSNVPVRWGTRQLVGGQMSQSDVSGQWNYHLDNFSLVINTTTDDQGRVFFVVYGSCVSFYITFKLEDLPDEPTLTWYGVLGISKMIAIIIITSGILILLAAVILGVICIRRRTSNESEVLHNAPNELIYADFDLQPISTSGFGAMAKPVMLKDGPETEYVDIDFNKKAAPLPDSEEEDIV